MPIGPDQWRSLADPAHCADGDIVSEPESNVGLVRDCEILLALRDALTGSTVLN